MSEFIDYEAMDAHSTNSEEDEEEQEDQENNQGSSFIDDNSVFSDQIASNYRLVKDSVFNFEESAYATAANVTMSYEEAMTF